MSRVLHDVGDLVINKSYHRCMLQVSMQSDMLTNMLCRQTVGYVRGKRTSDSNAWWGRGALPDDGGT